jgi:hypothetical protein
MKIKTELSFVIGKLKCNSLIWGYDRVLLQYSLPNLKSNTSFIWHSCIRKNVVTAPQANTAWKIQETSALLSLQWLPPSTSSSDRVDFWKEAGLPLLRCLFEQPSCAVGHHGGGTSFLYGKFRCSGSQCCVRRAKIDLSVGSASSMRSSVVDLPSLSFATFEERELSFK